MDIMITTILMGVIIAIILLGRYAIAEGQRIERQKKFDRNLRNFDSRKK
jgi:hypothetical protein